MGVFLFLIFPSMVLSFFVAGQDGVGFGALALMVMLRDLALVCLVAFFLWRNRERFAAIGWRTRGWWKEALIGVLLFGPVFFGLAQFENGLAQMGLSTPSRELPSFLTASGGGQFALATALVVIVAFSEETLFRGYLILRLGSVTGSAAAAVVLSSVVFSVGHGYEGSAGVVTVGTFGAIAALVYLWRGSLVAPMLMHFLQDFLGIVILPLLAGK